MPILGSDVAIRLTQIMPGIESVTLGIRGANEAAYTTETYANTRRTPATSQEMMMNGAVFGSHWIIFELYKTTETNSPKLGDSITDASSVVWQIKKIDVKMQQTVFRCLCEKNKA